jgi:hypothetical protein
MKFKKMLTNRSFMPMPSWQIVYEWEDDLSEGLGLELKDAAFQKYMFDNPFTRFLLGSSLLSKTVSFFDLRLARNNKAIAFDLFPRPSFSYITSVNVVPLIIDFWKNTDLIKFQFNYRNCPFICVSSLEALNFLKAKNLPMTFYHLPLSISERYKADYDQIYKEKKYDVILAGRENPILEQYLSQYLKKNPKVNVVQRKIENGKISFYSSVDGDLGEFNSRERYFELLKLCRIGFYSTPGIDGGEQRTGGFNPVTPRFLELMAAGCRVVARYADNDDTNYYEMTSIVENVIKYADFERVIDGYLSETSFPQAKYQAFLNKHYTTNRVNTLKNIFANYE